MKVIPPPEKGKKRTFNTLKVGEVGFAANGKSYAAVQDQSGEKAKVLILDIESNVLANPNNFDQLCTLTLVEAKVTLKYS